MNSPNILGSFFIGFGIMGVVWFVRKLFKPRDIQTTTKIMTIRWIILILSIIIIAGGWYIHSGFEMIPKGGLALGVILGIRVLINERTGRWY